MKTVLSSVCFAFVIYATAIADQFTVTTQGTTAMGWPAGLSNQEAWNLMPPALEGTGQQLPAWARTMVGRMPKTTAAFLQLDYAQRMEGPVDHKLRAAMRWTSAKANGSQYAMTIASGDAIREGESPEKWASLISGDLTGWSAKEKLALEFARAMTVESNDYTDSQFATLVENFDARQAASMVLHMAFANFQDRWFICLGIDADADGNSLPPVKASFDTKLLIPEAPPASPPTTTPPPAEIAKDAKTKFENVVEGPQQTWLSYDDLQDRLDQQRKRASRLPSPDWSEIASKLPAGFMEKPSDIVWYQLSFGYAHELAVPFEIYLRTAGGEVRRNWDRLFGGSIFWMVTDAVKCPYCMGHCEMNWEVAGLSEDQIAEQSRILAGNDWSTFTPAEQHGLAFARKLTQSPSSITAEDIEQLRTGLGEERAFYVALNSSRYNYMTRISNGFQLTLESDNVFWDYYNMPRPEKK